jgi:hypothetical protein
MGGAVFGTIKVTAPVDEGTPPIVGAMLLRDPKVKIVSPPVVHLSPITV